MEKSKLKQQNLVIAFIVCLLSLLLVHHPAWAAVAGQADIIIDTEVGQPVYLTVGKLGKLRSPQAVTRAHIVNPKIAKLDDNLIYTRHVIFIRGISVGTTQLTLWGKNDVPLGTFEVIVSPDVTGLKKSMYEIFPEENISIKSSGDRIMLTGTVSGAMKLKEVLTLAEAFAPEKIVNLLQVGGIQQVMLEVRIAEISKSVGNQLGINFSWQGSQGFGLNLMDGLSRGSVASGRNSTSFSNSSSSRDSNLSSNRILSSDLNTQQQTGTPFSQDLTLRDAASIAGDMTLADAASLASGTTISNVASLAVGSAANAVFGFLGGDPVIVAIDALQEEGFLQILAKPTLIAQSGQSASFLAGGEFPYPVPQGGVNNNVTIDWKAFGVSLNFTPTVLGNDTISMVVSPEVSDLDYSRAISYSGFLIPALDTRRMSTVVELKDNQSFAIAGLLKNNVRESVKKFPVLGDIPILGALFRSTKFQKDETELVVIVTPHLVKPINADEFPLPTDSFEDPTPFELLLLGRLEKWKDPNTEGDNPQTGAGPNPVMEGDFGYITPE